MMYAIIWLHFVADFVMQSHYVASNKSKNNRVLLYHVCVYGAPLALVFGWKYGLINAALHFGTDYVTSRLSGKMWRAERVHDFFVVIGADQAVHLMCLVATMPLITLWWAP